MKKLLLGLSLFCLSAFPSGKLSVSPAFYFDKKVVLPTLGVSVYEPVFLGLIYNSFTGGGSTPRFNQPNVGWFATRQDLEKTFGDLSVSVGATMRIMLQDGFDTQNENNLHVVLEYKLW